MAHEDPAPMQPPLEGVTANAQQPARKDRRPLQFSLRTVFLAMTGLSVVCAGLFAGPSWAAFVTAYCLLLAVPIILATVAIYERGYRRTFCVGALFAAVWFAYGLEQCWLYVLDGLFYGFDRVSLSVGPEITRWGICRVVGVGLVIVLVSGLLTVIVRRLVEAGQDPAFSRRW